MLLRAFAPSTLRSGTRAASTLVERRAVPIPHSRSVHAGRVTLKQGASQRVSARTEAEALSSRTSRAAPETTAKKASLPSIDSVPLFWGTGYAGATRAPTRATR